MYGKRICKQSECLKCGLTGLKSNFLNFFVRWINHALKSIRVNQLTVFLFFFLVAENVLEFIRGGVYKPKITTC